MGLFGSKNSKQPAQDSSGLYNLMMMVVVKLPTKFGDGSPLDHDEVSVNVNTVVDFFVSPEGTRVAEELEGLISLTHLLRASDWEFYSGVETDKVARWQLGLTDRVLDLRQAMLACGQGRAERALSAIAVNQLKALETSGRQEEVMTAMIRIAKEEHQGGS